MIDAKALSEAIAKVRLQGRAWSCLWELSQLSGLDQPTVRGMLDDLAAKDRYIFRDGAWVHWPDPGKWTDEAIKRFFDLRNRLANSPT